MTDFDYENMQKKITARGAYHKKNGSKSHRCTMPSDYMTKAQKEALNGPVTTILLNQPMDWVTFKGLSATLQKTYLTNLRDTYKPSASMMSRMFGCCTSSVTAELRKHGLPVGTKGNRPTTEQQAMWAAFCNGVIGGGDNVQPNEEAPADEPQVTCYDIDAEELERAKIAAELQTSAEEVTTEPELNLCDPDHPDHINARRCDDPSPDEELADAILDAFNKACEPAPCAMGKLATTMTGSPEGVVDNIRDLLSLFSGKVSVKLSIEVTE